MWTFQPFNSTDMINTANRRNIVAQCHFSSRKSSNLSWYSVIFTAYRTVSLHRFRDAQRSVQTYMNRQILYRRQYNGFKTAYQIHSTDSGASLYISIKSSFRTKIKSWLPFLALLRPSKVIALQNNDWPDQKLFILTRDKQIYSEYGWENSQRANSVLLSTLKWVVTRRTTHCALAILAM